MSTVHPEFSLPHCQTDLWYFHAFYQASKTPVRLLKNFSKESLVLAAGLPSLHISLPCFFFCFLFFCMPFYSCSFLCGDSDQLSSFFFEPLWAHVSPCSSHLVNAQYLIASSLSGGIKGAALCSHASISSLLHRFFSATESWKKKKYYRQEIEALTLIQWFSFCFYMLLENDYFCFTNVTNNNDTHHL